jgi:hypothetical protein
MSEQRASWPRRFYRWLFGGPFRQLPPPFGNPVPPDLQQFEAEARDAQLHGIGGVARQAPAHHAKSSPARDDGSLERQ